MKLSVKLFKVVLLVSLILIFFFYMFSKFFLLKSFTKIEINIAHTDVNVLLNYIKNGLQKMDNINIDTARWDDTYNYVIDRNNDYIESNFSDTTSLNREKINFIIITDGFGNIAYKLNIDDQKKVLFTEDLAKNTASNIYKLLKNSKTKNIMGIMLYNKKPILIVAERITKSDGLGHSPGILIYGKYYDENETKIINQNTKLQSKLINYNKNLIINSDSSKKDTFVNVTNENSITSYGLLNNIFSEPSFFIKITSQRNIFRNAKSTMNFYLLVLLIALTLFSLIIYLLIHFFVVKKIRIINSIVENVHNSHDVFTGVILKGNDEISEFGLKFNDMFYRLKKSDESIAEIQKKYTLKLEESNLKLKNEITEKVLAEDKIHHLIYYDVLTELYNRKKMQEDINILLENENEKFAILFIDLDNFKNANDNYGHLAGDNILKTVALRLKDIIRLTDTVYRIGGDEFIIILRDLTGTSIAEKIAVTVTETLGEVFTYKEDKLYIGASVGISLFPNHGVNVDDLIKNADLAMYEAKNNGGHGYIVYNTIMNEK